jgi:hypothetical protein
MTDRIDSTWTKDGMKALEAYLRELQYTHDTDTGVKETSYYPAIANLFNAVGKELKPQVQCVITIRNQGAGLPDGGLFTPDQIQSDLAGDLQGGQIPSRGVIEVKGAADDVYAVARSEQVERYCARYGQVLVTNLRAFLLVARNDEGVPALLEHYSLASTEDELWSTTPRVISNEHGERFTEYLKRVMVRAAPLTTPRDVAWILASYARDARARTERANVTVLADVRLALEQSLGMKFKGTQGERFFRSTLIQTLFYGVFSAWVLWSKEHLPTSRERYNWHEAQWKLQVPMVRTLFERLAGRSTLEPLGLVEVLDWTADALNRVDRAAFFAAFEEGHAVQYFYEPFLEAYDPELRKQLGVWYTPPEIVEYMVSRVDTVLREELELPDGLADPNVYVLDPCCGTGSYLVEVLRRIKLTLAEKGDDALLAYDLKRAATSRVFGFEILPAPFVVAHLQLGLLLQNAGVPLSDDHAERAGVYLTNALTGWDLSTVPRQLALWPELQAERDAAEQVKINKPILVVIGNPPYNGYAGLAMEEERDLSNAYRTTKRAAKPQGQGLNDLYVRFWRMAERRIVEETGKGIVCFISNYSWLDGLSYTGMRERYLEVFDRIWVDSLNGDKYRTGKLTPWGDSDPSVFSTEFNPEGIQVGTAISLMVRKEQHESSEVVKFRNLWGRTKRQQLVRSEEQNGASLYEQLIPPLGLGLPFAPAQVEIDYLSWPLLTALFPVSSPGVNTSRDLDLVATDRATLEKRMTAYFDPKASDRMLENLVPSLMTASGRYDPRATRRFLIDRGMASGQFVRYCYRPLDTRYVYWHPETKLLDEKREELFAAVQTGTLFLTSRQKGERQQEGSPFFVTRDLADRHLTRPGSACFPLLVNSRERRRGMDPLGTEARVLSPNLSRAALSYLASIDSDFEGDSDRVEDRLWLHALSTGYSPLYLSENAGAIRQDWPRIPLPSTKEALTRSAALGSQIVQLLDPTQSIIGVTSPPVRSELRRMGNIARVGGGVLNPDAGDLALTVGWGHAGKGGITMPGSGKLEEREYSGEELAAIEEGASVLGVAVEQVLAHLGDSTYDIYLNDRAYWRNVPSGVWKYTIGGYQVVKKWISYREQNLLGRPLRDDEARYVTEMIRRIAAILLLEPALNANYEAVKAAAFLWTSTEAEVASDALSQVGMAELL